MSLIKLAAPTETNLARERPVDFGGLRPKKLSAGKYGSKPNLV